VNLECVRRKEGVSWMNAETPLACFLEQPWNRFSEGPWCCHCLHLPNGAIPNTARKVGVDVKEEEDSQQVRIGNGHIEIIKSTTTPRFFCLLLRLCRAIHHTYSLDHSLAFGIDHLITCRYPRLFPSSK
jgi:hypothetical protein